MVWALFSQDGWITSSYGASGALFGLFAAILVVYQRIGIDIRSMMIWMLINFLMPIITPNIAWQACSLGCWFRVCMRCAAKACSSAR